jgi:hypothetical protein
MTITIPGNQQTNRDRQGADGRVPAAQPAPTLQPAPEPAPAPAPEVAPPGPAGGPVPAPAPQPEVAPAPTADTPLENPYAPTAAPPLQSGLEAPPAPDASTWDVMAAAWQRDTITGDVAGFADRQRQGLALDMFYALPASAQARITMNPLDYASGKARFEQLVMDEAARYAAQNPTGWGDLPLTREQFDARLLNADQAALDEANAILAQPGGGIAEFTGAVARDFTRPANLALMPLGGAAGSFLKFVATEAALSGVSSVAALPGQYSAADRLGLPDPNAAQQVAVDTAIGGAFAGVLGGIAKGLGWAYARTTGTRAAMPPGANPTEFEAGVAAAESQLTGNRTVQEETRDATAPGPLTLPPGNVPYNEAAVLRAIIGVESGGNARAQNPNSSARGLGQFISSTWLNMIRKYRPDLAEGRSANEVLALRDDPNINAEMTAMYTRENHALLQSQGLPTNPGELYLAHFMGPGGAVSALRAPLNAPISSIMSQDAIAANAGIRFGGKRFSEFTAGDLRRWAAHKMRSAYDPNASADMPTFTDSGTSRGYTQSGQVTAGDEFTIDVDYEVVDYSSLIRASGDLQPRDRSQINSDDWIAATAARLDPAQLLPSPNAANGPPIVGPDNIIESGNGRSLAIARAFERAPDRAQAYVAAIEQAGYTIPEGVTRPVLIARRRSELTADQRRQFVVEAQDSGVAVMTPTEMARATARSLQAPILSRLDVTEPINAAANGDFVRAVLATLPRSARNAMYDATGNLNANGQRQLREALFARAWPDPDILARYTEGTAKELRSLLEALEAAAPNWAALRADIEAGLVVPELDISPYILDAMRLIAAARDTAQRSNASTSTIITEMLDAVDMLEGAISPLTAALVRKFWTNGRAAPADQVSGFLARYADEAREAGKAGGMFDAPTPQDVLRTVDAAAFRDLPAELGRARGFATPTPPAARLTDDAFTAGAASPEAEAAGAEIAATVQEPGFGPVFDQFENDPQGAIAHLLAQRQGEVRNAFASPENPVANLTLIYGDETMGLRHIQDKHPEMISRLPDLLRNGRTVTDPADNPRLYIVDDADPASVAVVRLDYDGFAKTWLVTAFEDNQGKFARQVQTSNGPPASASPRVPDATGRIQDTPDAPADQGLTATTPKVPASAARVAAIINDGKAVSTIMEGLTKAERRWLKTEYAAGRLARQEDNMLRNVVRYRRVTDDLDARWQIAEQTAPADKGLTATPNDPALDDAAATLFDAQSAIIAARADTGDFDIDMPDGTTMRASDVLDDLARDADTDFQITFCTTNGGTA